MASQGLGGSLLTLLNEVLLSRKLIQIFVAICVLMNSFSLWGADSSQASSLPGSGIQQDEKKWEMFLRQVESFEKTPLDPFQLLRQRVLNPKLESMQLRDLEFVVLDAHSKELGRFDIDKNRSIELTPENRQFALKSKSSNFMHYFYLKAERVFVFDEKLFWIESDFRNQRFFYWIDPAATRLGKNSVPVFRVPVEAKQAAAFKTMEGALFLNDKKILPELLETVSKAQLLSLNMLANLLSPSEAVPELWVERFFESYIEALTKSEKHMPTGLGLNKAGLIKAIESNPLAESLEENKARLQFSKILREKENAISEQRSSHSELMLKFNALAVSALKPSVQAVDKVKNSLHLVYLNKKINSGEGFKTFKDVMFELKTKPVFLLSLVAGGALASYSLYPEEFITYSVRTLESVQYVVNTIFGKLGGLWQLSKESLVATFAGFNYQVFAETYITEGKAAKTALGIGSVLSLALVSIFVPHILVNTYKLGKEIRGYRERSSSLKEAFILRQKELEISYLNLLTDLDSKNKPNDSIFKPDDLVGKYHVELASKRDFPSSKWFKYWSGLRERLGAFPSEKRKLYENRIEEFSDAMKHFLFSSASFTKSGEVFVHFWNSLFVFRALVFKPRMIPYLLLYPRYFHTVVSSRGEEAHIPSKFNLGRTSLWNYSLEKAEKIIGLGRDLKLIHSNSEVKVKERVYQSLDRIFYSQGDTNEKYDPINKEIVYHLEWALEKWVLREANLAALSFSEHSTEQEAISRKAFKTLTEKGMNSLSYRTRVFYYWYYKNAMEEVFPQLVDYMVKNDSANLEEMNRQVRSSISSKEIVVSEAKRFAEGVVSKFLESSFYDPKTMDRVNQKASDISSKVWFNLRNYLANYEMKALYSVDPRNSQSFERYAVVLEQAKKPKAMARAIRSTLANLVVDRPIELVFMLFMVAGAQGELLKPLHDEMFGPNSFMYMSRYHFLSGFFHGMVAGFMYEIWMKLQYDVRLDSSGVFEKVPTGKQARSSFKFYYLQNFKEVDNSWWKNQWFISKLAWANIGVASLSYASSQYLYLGRVDLDLYFAGYLMFFLSPFTGLAGMFENAFEKSTGWVMRDIPKRYRNSKFAIKYGEYAKSRLRFRYNLWYSIYDNSVEYFLTNLKSMETLSYGTRGFSRWLLAGLTFTEAAILGIESLETRFPSLKPATGVCKSIFSKNATDMNL